MIKIGLAENVDLKRLYAVSRFITLCILPDGYRFPDPLSDALVLTSAGEETLNTLKSQYPGMGEADIVAALLAEFAISDELLIDHEATSFESVREVLSPDMRDLSIRYPWAYGDELENVYLETYGQRPEAFLPYQETMAVVRGLPQGVFQVADVSVGPFGMLLAAQERYLPSGLCGPEIACADPGCPEVHHVIFRTGETDAGKVYSSIGRDVPLSHRLKKLLTDLRMPDASYYQPDNDWGLPWLLMSGFNTDERHRLLSRLLVKNEDGVRDTAHRLLGRGASKKSPDEIARNTTEAQLLQLLLCVGNDRLIWNLEELIDTDDLRMGATEIRYPIRSRHAEGGYFQAKAEVSRLGIRFRPSLQLTHLRLKNFVQQLYAGDTQDEILWLLRHEQGSSSQEKLGSYLSRSRPEDVIKNLVLATRERMNRAIAILGSGRFVFPTDPDSEQALIQRILWKLGAPLPPPPVSEARTRKHLSAFLRSSEAEESRTEAGVEAVRSHGVSMFVALEELLSETVNYICWLLFSDHYPAKRDARFVYRAEVAKKLSDSLLSAYAATGSKHTFAADGKNSLGVLVSAFAMMADLCADPDRVVTRTTRSADVMPLATRYTPIYEFPFAHTRLIFDIRPESRQNIIAVLRSVTTELVKNDVPRLRNSLSHPRSSFPGNHEVVRACLSIRQSLASLRSLGLFPTVYRHMSRTTDEFGRCLDVMQDGDGFKLQLVGPSEIDKSGLPRLEHPQLIPTGLQFNHSDSPIRLRYVEETPFTALLDAHVPIPFPEPTSSQVKSAT